MKKIIYTKSMMVFSLIVLYFVGQLLGSLSIRYFFIEYKIQELRPLVASIATDIGEDTFVLSKNDDFILKYYDLFGNEIDLFTDGRPAPIPDDGISSTLKPFIPRVIAGNDIASLKRIADQASESIVIGQPVVVDGVVLGAVFLMKPASDFSAVLNGFYLVFSITLLIGWGIIGTFLALYLKESKALEKTRRDYIANISHELKSPIASIKALTETLADQVVVDEEIRGKYYGIILSESKRLQKLINDMLELSKLQSRKHVFTMERIEPFNVMTQVETKYASLADELGLRFELRFDPRTLPELLTNPDRLVQLFSILIDNAFKFSKEDGLIWIDAKIHRTSVDFIVGDEGIGIPREVLDHIFERFYQADPAHQGEGHGLGLSIAKEIVEGLGGTLDVKSEEGKGTRFIFTLPRHSD